MAVVTSVNPSTYEVLGEVPVSTHDEVIRAVENARITQPSWAAIGVATRVELLRSVYDWFEAELETIALMQAREIGVPIVQSRGDIASAISFGRWYFDNALQLLAPRTTFEDDKQLHQVFAEPLGVVASITPWNFPINNVTWNALQALTAGNTVVLKASEECPLIAKFIEEAFTARLPANVFAEVYGDGKVGEHLANQAVDLITFTGSTRTGRTLYEIAARRFIPVSLELGGSAPGVVCADVDIASVAESVCDERLYNNGQVCDGLKRLIVHNDIHEEFVTSVAKHMHTKCIGNGEDAGTQVGPLATKRQLALLCEQVEDAVSKGATVVTGGESLEEAFGGAFYQPTILTNVTPDMRVWSEEVFGPVLPVVKFTSEDEALSLANDTPYGLGAYVFTQDNELAARLASGITTGMVSINNASYVKPFNPFGGAKASGIGREHGHWGFDEVTQPKVVASPKD